MIFCISLIARDGFHQAELHLEGAVHLLVEGGFGLHELCQEVTTAAINDLAEQEVVGS